ncbi:telomere-protecting terminal protein Tpg [Streptomyces sp. NPDC090085]|uniref:telomere-protecting terminal protein Tpg n=1 Tax=Streptomyces sp. NPDC090085 TaxID=3365943 RepID=UPI0037F38EB7
MVDSLGDSLDRALEGAFTRRIPQSARAQMKYLVKQLKGTKAAAQALGISQRTVERYVAGKLKRPRQELRGRLEREGKKRWQPQVRAKARKKAASADGLILTTRARFGFKAAGDTSDDARIRDLPPRPCLRAPRSGSSRHDEAGDTESGLLKIAAEGLAEVYFRAANSRAHGLGVEFTDVERLDIDLWASPCRSASYLALDVALIASVGE